MKITRILSILTLAGAAAACWSPESNRNARPAGSAPPAATPTAGPTGASPAPTAANSAKMNVNTADAAPKSGGFQGNLPAGFQMPTEAVGQRMLREYGAMFVARGVTPPPVVVFRDEAEVAAFQNGVAKSTENIGGISIELQAAAMKALSAALAEASSKNLSIAPRNADSAKRSYRQTVDNWKSRVDPGLDFWVGKGRVTAADAARIRALSPAEQVAEIFRLEAQGIFFAQGNQKSIVYSVAPPGTSQHISMLALDVARHDDAAVRELLGRHGWFQTVVSDLPHFTYLGAAESELPGLGLKKVADGGRTYWIPNL